MELAVELMMKSKRRRRRRTDGMPSNALPLLLHSPFSRTEMLEMLLLSVWCSEATAENSMSPELRMAARVL